MNKKARSNLRKVVTQARQLVEEDIRTQLKRLGIEESGKTVPAGRLTHLRREDKNLRDKILAAIQKEQVRNVRRGEAYDRYVRHVGFTYLNRLAALRAMEVRELIKETVIRRDQYAGMSRREYEISEREDLSDHAEITRRSLLEAFNKVSQEIKVLFDVSDEYSLLFPSPRTLDRLMKFLGEEVPEADWREDDIIGWIYQYYNSEARSEFKKKRRKPRPDDVPVINQFYTPRWLVRALVDNTLGRLWLEMKERIPKLGEAKAPNEERLMKPKGETVDEYCSYLILLRQEPSPREKKGVREIKVLDPACGSGHFLVYAFDVLYRMYLEDEPETPPEEIPRLILENNLFGIDIDLRSVQLAALSLFLKAKEYNRDVKIGKMNLVCADVRITDGDLQKEFISRLESDVDLQRIFARLFKELEFTYDVGSLLKVRAPFERLLEARRKGVQTRFQPKITGQSFLSKRGGVGGQSKLSTEEIERSVFVKPAVTLEEMLDALLEFEREGMEKKDMGTMLFAAEAEKSVGLLQLLSQKYDVVLMNPPYGRDMPETTKKYLRKHYPKTHHDYYTAFIEQTIDLCLPEGFVGALISRTFLFLKSFQSLRSEILWKDAAPQILLDLGFGVLDEATGRWAAMTCQNLSKRPAVGRNCLFFRLTDIGSEKERIDSFERGILSWRNYKKYPLIYNVGLGDLRKVPGNRYAYWTTSNLRSIYSKYPPLDRDVAKRPETPKIADVKHGLGTRNDKRFTRKFWEVKKSSLGKQKGWVPFAKDIEYDSRFYANFPAIVKWKNDGQEIKDWIIKRYPYLKEKYEWCVTNEDFYFREGLTWSMIASSKHLAFRRLAKGTIFSVGHEGLFPSSSDPRSIYSILAWANSVVASFTVFQMDPLLHNLITSEIARIPFSRRVLKNEVLASIAHESHDLLREWDTGNETSNFFIKPWILQILKGFNLEEHPISGHPYAKEFEWADYASLQKIRRIRGSRAMSLDQLAKLSIERENKVLERIKELHHLIDEEVYQIYGISEEERELIEKELGPRGCLLRSMDEDFEERTKEHVMRLISFYVKGALETDKDGIVSLNDLTKEVRHNIALDFGENQVERREKEIEEILGCSLEEWLAYEFFDFHVDFYERRPIFWHLTSANFAKGRHKKGAFNCFLHYHKIDRDTIPKIRTRREYLKSILDGAKWRTERLRRELQAARDSGDKRRERQLQVEYEEALDKYNELRVFDQKLAEVSNPRDEPTELDEDASWVDRKIAEVKDNGWDPVLDYGVRVNIEPLKEAELLHRAAYMVK